MPDHPAACRLSGFLKRRSVPLEKMFVRVIKEGGVQVLERQKLVDMRLETPVPAGDRREIEIVVKHLHYVRGNVPLACDVTLVSPLTTAGEARPRAAEENGIAIQAAEKAKADKYPELLHSMRCRLVVLAGEVGGRWSAETVRLIEELAKHRSRNAPRRLRKSTRLAWANRWWGMLAVAAQDSLAATLASDAPHLLHGWEGRGPSLGELLHGEAPTISRLPLR